MIFRAAVFSPICSITSAAGPIKTNPASLQARANAALSARKPYPGWMASASDSRAASKMRSIRRYDSPGSALPMVMAISAISACMAWRSTSEHTATVPMPNSLQALMIRTAISPRLATSTRLMGWATSNRLSSVIFNLLLFVSWHCY